MRSVLTRFNKNNNSISGQTNKVSVGPFGSADGRKRLALTNECLTGVERCLKYGSSTAFISDFLRFSIRSFFDGRVGALEHGEVVGQKSGNTGSNKTADAASVVVSRMRVR
jgi:hypothetical protein